MTTKTRVFLFLQGPCSPFFAELASHLRALGHRVFKVNFTSGDYLYWRSSQGFQYHARLAELPAFLEHLWLTLGITDQVLFGDCRPVHQPAITHGQQLGIRNYVFEEGYFRPFWITLEREGVNSHSRLPKDAQWYKDVGTALPELEPPHAFQSPFSVRATHDVLYNVANLSNPLFFRDYRSHAPVPAMLEYAGYLQRFAINALIKKHDNVRLTELIRNKTSFYFLPLQLSSDTQITQHSSYSSMIEVLEEVMASFSCHAATHSWLVIKIHPLDAGLINYDKVIKHLALRYAITERVLYLQVADLQQLLAKATGTVTVNSTVGGLALSYHCPTITLADPIYNLPGLTFQGKLDDFWPHAEPPDALLFKLYSKTIIHTTQINGGFYCHAGIRLAIKHSERFFAIDRSPLELLL